MQDEKLFAHFVADISHKIPLAINQFQDKKLKYPNILKSCNFSCINSSNYTVSIKILN